MKRVLKHIPADREETKHLPQPATAAGAFSAP